MSDRERFARILDDVGFDGWRFAVEDAAPGLCLMRVRFEAPDNATGETSEQVSRPWPLTHGMTASAVVGTALKAVLTAIEHEARERFTYKGAAVFGPHYDVEELLALYEFRHPASADESAPQGSDPHLVDQSSER